MYNFALHIVCKSYDALHIVCVYLFHLISESIRNLWITNYIKILISSWWSYNNVLRSKRNKQTRTQAKHTPNKQYMSITTSAGSSAHNPRRNRMNCARFILPFFKIRTQIIVKQWNVFKKSKERLISIDRTAHSLERICDSWNMKFSPTEIVNPRFSYPKRPIH